MIKGYERAVFIIGSTAVGKTKLGIDIAQRINGEIISSDSMQLYEKASLMTAKPTPEEQSLIKHHLIDFLPQSKIDFTVRDYQQLALSAVRDIESRNKIPIFVGGTMYYIESMLYDRIFTPGDSLSDHSTSIPDQIDLQELQKSDPNPRHFRNALNYIKKTGEDPSNRPNTNKLRFKSSIIIWLYCDPEVLKTRVKDRISQMINNGGLDEVREILADNGGDYTKGVLQSIGYKEIEPCLNDRSKIDECIERLVVATIQYSKKQIRWIKNRMQPFLKVNMICTDHAQEWDRIKEEAFRALECEVEEEVVVIPKVEVKNCGSCGVVLRGRSEWEQHIKSRQHQKRKDLDFTDDEEERKCEVCEKLIKGRKAWEFHVKSRKHTRKVKKV